METEQTLEFLDSQVVCYIVVYCTVFYCTVLFCPGTREGGGAEVMETLEEETTVRLVDYGYMKTVQDSQCLRELPEEWRHFMTMAVELELGVIPIEENQDVLIIFCTVVKIFYLF